MLEKRCYRNVFIIFFSFTSRNFPIAAFNQCPSPSSPLVTATSSGTTVVMPEARCPWQRCHANPNHVPCLATKQLSAPRGLSQQLTRNKHLLCCRSERQRRGGGGGGGWGVEGSWGEQSEGGVWDKNKEKKASEGREGFICRRLSLSLWQGGHREPL